MLDGILWILRTGARWHKLPDRFPPYQTCYRRFQMWVKDGTLKSILEILAEDLRTRHELNLSEFLLTAVSLPLKKGGKIGKTKLSKGIKVMTLADGFGIPVAIHTDSASSHGVKLVGKTLAEVFTNRLPTRLIGDKAYDSDPLDAELIEQEVEMIAPHK